MRFMLSNLFSFFSSSFLFSPVSHIPTFVDHSTAAGNHRGVASLVRHGALCPASPRSVLYNIAYASIQWKTFRYIKVNGETFNIIFHETLSSRFIN